MTDDPEKDTLQGIFRLLGEMKAEMTALRNEMTGMRGELRAAKNDLGEEIDGLAARLTADKASIDGQMGGLRQDLNVLRDDFSRHATSTKSILDSHTARFRTFGNRFDEMSDQNKAIIDRLDRAFVPAE